VKDNCEIILESDRQIEEAKVEYQAVTSYLTDMQRIDMIPEDQRETWRKLQERLSACRRTEKSFRGKVPYCQTCNIVCSNATSSRYLRSCGIKDSEQYQAMIDQDMMHLEKSVRF
jgi:hypothetical protein